jgi:Holliday junction DNA helicase RuvA
VINYLKGQVIGTINTPNNRIMLILEVNQIGYELQIPSRLARQLSVTSSEIVQIFTHLQVREDQQTLYGFTSAAERDLFRQLLSVNGIGSQMAIALIDTLGLEDLVQAIVSCNIRSLSRTPGVGQKTAERLSLELKAKLSQWREVVGVSLPSSTGIPSPEILADVEMTLLALGYTSEEIVQSLSVLSQDRQMLKNTNVEDWIRSAIIWLSQEG